MTPVFAGGGAFGDHGQISIAGRSSSAIAGVPASGLHPASALEPASEHFRASLFEHGGRCYRGQPHYRHRAAARHRGRVARVERASASSDRLRGEAFGFFRNRGWAASYYPDWHLPLRPRWRDEDSQAISHLRRELRSVSAGSGARIRSERRGLAPFSAGLEELSRRSRSDGGLGQHPALAHRAFDQHDFHDQPLWT